MILPIYSRGDFSDTPEISVVIPAHNEAENLPTLLAEIRDALRPLDRPFEILVIDDQSTDTTPELLEQLTGELPELVPCRLNRNCGQSAALSCGFDLARGDIVVTLDADLQNDPADIPRLLDELEDADLAIGWRKDRKDPLSKRVISKVANRVRNWMTNEDVRDTGCGLKAFRRETLPRLPRFKGMHRFFPTLVRMQGFRVAQVPVNHRPRVHGRTHYNLFNRSIQPMADLLAIRWLQRRWLDYELEKEPALVRR